MKKKTERAGLVLYHLNEDKEIRIIFMTPSDPKYGGPLPQIPKGKVDKGETPKEAAIREAQEEVGLFKPNIVGDVNSMGKFVSIHMFIAEVSSVEQFGDPHYETGETHWLTPAEFQDKGRELHRPAISAAARFIKKKHNLK